MNKFSPGTTSLIRQYPFLLLLTALASGILTPTLLPKVNIADWLFFTCCSGAIATWLHLLRNITVRLQVLRTLAIAFSFMGLGATLSCLQDVRNHRSWYGHQLQQAEALIVAIDEAPQLKEKTILLPVRVKSIKVAHRWVQATGALQLYVYRKEGMPAYRSGQTLMIPPDLVPIRSSHNPFAFDYAVYAARQGLYHQAFLPATVIRMLNEVVSKTKPLTGFRNTLQQCIAANIKDSTTRSLIEATVLNERASLDDELWQAYSVTGIVHIIAISGMHIVLLAGLLLFLLRIIPFKRFDWFKYLLAIAVIWCYIAISGFPPSAVRAALMFTLMALGLIFHRESNSINIWAATGFLLLCYNPYWIYNVGVQLSFLAVLSIFLFYNPVKKWYTPSGFIAIWLRDIIAVSIAVQILVAPLVIYYFHQFPLMGLLANVPAAVFGTLLLYGTVCLFCLHGCGIPCLWLGEGLTWLTLGFHKIIRFLAIHTPVLMQQLYIDNYQYWIMMLAIAAFGLALFYKKRFYLYVGLLISVLLFTDLVWQDAKALRQERIIVYNVSRTSMADVFKGKRVSSVYASADAVSGKTGLYTSVPARLALRATTVQQQEEKAVYKIGKATILFLDRYTGSKAGQSFPVDFLVVNRQCTFDPEAWYYTFHPRMIIIDGSLPRWKAIQWRQQLVQLGANVHWVQEDGAWVYPAL